MRVHTNVGEIIIPRQTEMNMSLEALIKIAEFILEHKMKPEDNFTITGTDGKKLIIHIK